MALGTSSSYIRPSFNTDVKSGGVTVSINLAIRGNGSRDDDDVVVAVVEELTMAAAAVVAALASLSSFPELMPEEWTDDTARLDAAAAIRAARVAARLASFTAALRAATGSTLDEVGPLINWMETEAPGGR